MAEALQGPPRPLPPTPKGNSAWDQYTALEGFERLPQALCGLFRGDNVIQGATELLFCHSTNPALASLALKSIHKSTVWTTITETIIVGNRPDFPIIFSP